MYYQLPSGIIAAHSRLALDTKAELGLLTPPAGMSINELHNTQKASMEKNIKAKWFYMKSEFQLPWIRWLGWANPFILVTLFNPHNHPGSRYPHLIRREMGLKEFKQFAQRDRMKNFTSSFQVHAFPTIPQPFSMWLNPGPVLLLLHAYIFRP